MTPDHWLPIGDGWHLWRDLELRGAGFPASWLAEMGAPETARRAEAWLAAEGGEEAVARLDDLARSHEAAQRRIGGVLQRFAGDARFREALAWQNRSAARAGIDWLLRNPAEASNSRARQNKLLVASYVQRYAAKNDRIGFFGPHSWGRMVDAGAGVDVRPGPSLLARRIARLEAWAIDALADALERDPELRVDLAPRLMPTVRVEGSALHHSVDRTTALPPAYARLLAACDGRTSARRIADELAADASLDLSGPDEVLEMLDELVGKRVVVWGLDVPSSGGRPEALLRAALERVEPGPARERAKASLDQLERARDEVGHAAGSPDATEAALRRLDDVFVRLTGAEPSRNAGKTYAGRRVAFETCHRDVALEVGPAIWQEAAPGLRLLLASARWFTWEIAARYRAALAALHDRLCREQGGGERRVEYLRVAAHLPELFPGGGQAGSIVDQVRRELRARWRRVLRFEGHERVVRRAAGEIAEAVRDAFAAPGPGWPSARHHSIDLLVAARGPEDVARGDHAIVVGEIHPGLNALLLPDLPHPYGARDVLFERRDEEIGRPCVAPVWSRARTHVDYYSRSPGDYEVEHGPARAWRPRDRVLAAADLVVEEGAAGLEVRTRDGRVAFDVVAFLEHHLIAESHQQFGIAGGEPHTPRIEIDRLVVTRERWSAAPSELDFARVADPVLRFARARAWALRLGLPRTVFLRTPEEVKPTCIDLESPIFVDLAARAVRAASEVTVSEMLPAEDQCWLPDGDGLRYTSELRMAAVDPERWSPPR